MRPTPRRRTSAGRATRCGRCHGAGEEAAGGRCGGENGTGAACRMSDFFQFKGSIAMSIEVIGILEGLNLPLYPPLPHKGSLEETSPPGPSQVLLPIGSRGRGPPGARGRLRRAACLWRRVVQTRSTGRTERVPAGAKCTHCLAMSGYGHASNCHRKRPHRGCKSTNCGNCIGSQSLPHLSIWNQCMLQHPRRPGPVSTQV